MTQPRSALVSLDATPWFPGPSGSDQGKALIIIENRSNFSAGKLFEAHFRR